MSDKPKVSDIRDRATKEGVLDATVIKLPVSRWPRWAQARYIGDDEPASGPDRAVDPLTVDDL